MGPSLERLIGRVRVLPGVRGAGLVSAAPGEGWNGDAMISVVEHPPLPLGQTPDVLVRGADPDYFSAIGIPLKRGRVFTLDERLNRANVVVISDTAAKQLFPGEDPIGKHLRNEGDLRSMLLSVSLAIRDIAHRRPSCLLCTGLSTATTTARRP
jgi:hypothetical protein